jgi:hypothetical protein
MCGCKQIIQQVWDVDTECCYHHNILMAIHFLEAVSDSIVAFKLLRVFVGDSVQCIKYY